MENSTQTEEMSIVELSKSINLKLDQIHTVLGYILEKTKHIPEPERFTLPDYSNLILNQEPIDEGEQTDDNLDARDAEGTVLPVE
jgi:CBS domain containing-hemolysin-like protein